MYATQHNVPSAGVIVIPGFSTLPLRAIAAVVGADCYKPGQCKYRPRLVGAVGKNFTLTLFATGKTNLLGACSFLANRIAMLELIDMLRPFFPGVHIANLRVTNIQITGQLGKSFYREAFLASSAADDLRIDKQKRFLAVFIKIRTHITALLFHTGSFVLVGSKTIKEAQPALRDLYTFVSPFLEPFDGDSTEHVAPPDLDSPGPGSLLKKLLGGNEL